MLGARQWCWCRKRRVAYGSVLTFAASECLHMKKDSYPLLRKQEVLESLVGAGHFSCLDLKLGFCQIKMEEASKQYTAFTHR